MAGRVRSNLSSKRLLEGWNSWRSPPAMGCRAAQCRRCYCRRRAA